jgi:hypothetical protein
MKALGRATPSSSAPAAAARSGDRAEAGARLRRQLGLAEA